MVEAATLSGVGCSPVWCRLQPCVSGCSPTRAEQVTALHKECDKGMFSDFKEQVLWSSYPSRSSVATMAILTTAILTTAIPTTGAHRDHRWQLPRAERLRRRPLREAARQVAGHGTRAQSQEEARRDAAGHAAQQARAIPTMAMLTMAMLTMAMLTMAMLTMAMLTMAILGQARAIPILWADRHSTLTFALTLAGRLSSRTVCTRL
jgi:hypothetical protein